MLCTETASHSAGNVGDFRGMSKLENNCSISVSVGLDGSIVMNITAGDGIVILTQNQAGAHRVACDLLEALAQVRGKAE